MKVMAVDYSNMASRYWGLVQQLPPELIKQFPNFANFVWFTAKWKNETVYDYYILSEEGARRWQMLEGPHALTMLRAWAIKKEDKNNDMHI